MKVQVRPMGRTVKQVILMLADATLVGLAFWFSILLANGSLATDYAENFFAYLVLLSLSSVLIFYHQGIYRTILLYMGIQSVLIILKAVTLTALLMGVILYFDNSPVLTMPMVPIFWMLALLLIGGKRIMIKIILQNLIQNFRPKEPVIIYGAGSSGTQLAIALINGNQYLPVAFVDDSDSMIGSTVHGIRVHHPSALDNLLDTYSVRQLLLAIPSATHQERKKILNHLEHFPIHVKTVPDLFDMVAGKVGVDEIRDIDIEDLLGRNIVPPHPHLMSACIQGYSVMVTGAGGSIGSELCRQILKVRPTRLVLFDNSEYGLYSIEEELRELLQNLGNEGGVEVIALLGSVRNRMQVENAIRRFQVKTVYHAAAYKQLPMVEKNIVEGVQNNIFGTLVVANAADSLGVENFVFISTDKAVRPSSIMGATKRCAEQILQAMAARGGKTRFSMVRFGNVLGSSGSVVPLFREQIRQGGPATVTHPEVTRYFMTVQEAAQLVIQAGSMSDGGDVFVLDMGEPVKILDLAHKMIHLMGRLVKDENNRNGDIEVVYTGLREGEKLNEELLIGEEVSGTEHPKIMRAEEDFIEWTRLEALLERLQRACVQMDQPEIREVLSEAIGGFVSKVKEVDPLLEAEPPRYPEESAKVARLY